MRIVVVGFRMDRKASVGYKDFPNSLQASDYVMKLLDEGAEVISIRVVRETPGDRGGKIEEGQVILA